MAGIGYKKAQGARRKAQGDGGVKRMQGHNALRPWYIAIRPAKRHKIKS